MKLSVPQNCLSYFPLFWFTVCGHGQACAGERARVRGCVCVCVFDHYWSTFGPCLDHIWAMFGPCWAMFGPCLDHVWTMFGPCFDHVWARFGPVIAIIGTLPYTYTTPSLEVDQFGPNQFKSNFRKVDLRHLVLWFVKSRSGSFWGWCSTRACSRARACACVCARVCACASTCVRVRVRAYARACACVRVRMCARTCACSRVHAFCC
jgi:hypothetical protein